MIGVKDGMIVTIPFTIIGSLFLIIAYFPVKAWTDFIQPYQAVLTVPVSVTFDMLGVIAVIGISYHLAKNYGLDPILSAILSLIAFLIVQTGKVGQEYTLTIDNFGTKGIFAAIIVAIISVEILRFMLKRNWVIRMPASVPATISKSFELLTPLAVVIMFFWLIRVVIGIDINHVLNLLFSPLVFSLNTLWGILLFMLLRSLLWCVGIHGAAVLSVADPIFLQMLGANTSAVTHGDPVPFITAAGFMNYVFIGGGGATLMLVVFMLFSKDKGLRTLGKLCLPGSIFEINEPVVFGVPVVLNPIMMIPYILGNIILTFTTYLVMYFGLIGKPVVNVPFTMPPILMQYLSSGGDWRAAVYGVIEIIISAVIYYPFFKALEKQRLNQGQQGGEQHESDLTQPMNG
ncbi:permease IIC component [Pullulanibacillus camelliae]|uniref:Permease IIC component n=2 Tax=Pullulanibacillus camelliae TaxID=1707096 RepID=A0A8J3E0Z6_9BACL|nr:permease IIC component [Pullulanibacillus camelliae]